MIQALCLENFNGKIINNENLASHSTYKIGGPAKFFAFVNDEQSLQNLIKKAKKCNINWTIIGGGSNFLFSDEGFDGLIIKLDGDFKKFSFNKQSNICCCGAGVKTQKIYNEFQKNCLSGLEFCAGIPGTIGGATKMNAGMKNEWISQSLKSVRIINSQGEIRNLDAKNMKWGYRYSEIDDCEVILSVEIEYKKIASEQEKQNFEKISVDYKQMRQSKQPYGSFCCGSVFKNPQDNFAGKLIEDAGFKGKSIGGASVSDIHCNFIVNNNNAKASDVVCLIQAIQRDVYEKNNIKLMPEVKFLGFKDKVSLF